MVKQKSIIYEKIKNLYIGPNFVQVQEFQITLRFLTRTKFVGKSQYKVKFKVINNWIYTVTQITVR